MTNNHLLSALGLCLLLAFAGCRASRELPEMVAGDAVILSPKELLRAIENRPYPEYYQGRVSGVMSTDKGSTNFSARVLGKRDSVAIVTLSVALGIEVGKVKLTPDSVFFQNRFDKSYIADSYEALGELVDVPIDLRIFEALFTGEPLFEMHRKSNFSDGIEPETYLYNEVLKSGAAYSAVVRAEDGLIAVQSIQRAPGETAELHSLSFTPLDDIIWVRTGEMHYREEKTVGSPQTTHVKYRTSGLSTEKITTFPFEVPKSYVRKN